MRSLSLTEVQTVSGSGYTEDITATAATLYVAGRIGGFAGGFTLGIGKGLVTLAGGVGNFLGLSLMAVTNVASPLLAVGAPLAIGLMILDANPDLQTAFIDKCQSYFG